MSVESLFLSILLMELATPCFFLSFFFSSLSSFLLFIVCLQIPRFFIPPASPTAEEAYCLVPSAPPFLGEAFKSPCLALPSLEKVLSPFPPAPPLLGEVSFSISSTPPSFGEAYFPAPFHSSSSRGGIFPCSLTLYLLLGRSLSLSSSAPPSLQKVSFFIVSTPPLGEVSFLASSSPPFGEASFLASSSPPFGEASFLVSSSPPFGEASFLVSSSPPPWGGVFPPLLFHLGEASFLRSSSTLGRRLSSSSSSTFLEASFLRSSSTFGEASFLRSSSTLGRRLSSAPLPPWGGVFPPLLLHLGEASFLRSSSTLRRRLS
ncbi:unnamed protein product [Acanthosepion pharaonis]|uniref:Uncharacterized protein n=1 Tax=Acanthosepion pharaonis TaxID=158019 RepID=A0A812B764_ACAPH|nr:unnamed protein product [Sepia pharaonis]